MRINFGELRIGEIAKSNLQKIVDTNWASEGPLVKEFEDGWSRQFDYKHSISMSSGTDADINCCLCLYDKGAQRGDEIICPALTFIATANSILAAGFIPKFVDIDRKTLNIDHTKIESAITPKTKAIMVTHTMGKPCEMDVIMDLAKRYNLFVFEDACEAAGAKYKGQYVGKIGHVGTCSFYTAHLVVCGEGGMCFTDHDDFAYLLRSTKSHGRVPGSTYFKHVRHGLNSKMNDLEAALGLEGLYYIDETISKRCTNKSKLLNLLSDLTDVLQLEKSEHYEFISPHALPMVLQNDDEAKRDQFYKYLEANSIQCKTLFGSVPTQQDAFKFMDHKHGEFPEAEYVGRNGLHIGIHQYLTHSDLEYISNIVHKFFQARNS